MKHPLTHCDKDVSPDCQGHASVDKWPDCVSEECWQYPDQETGNVDGFGRYIALIIQNEDETTAAGILVKAGTYLVITEDDRGFVDVTTFDSAQAAQDLFDRWESAYGDYCHGVDLAESRIMTTTGRIGR